MLNNDGLVAKIGVDSAENELYKVRERFSASYPLRAQEGALSYCCTPCFCDLKDFAQVDSVTVAGETYDAIVIGEDADSIR